MIPLLWDYHFKEKGDTFLKAKGLLWFIYQCNLNFFKKLSLKNTLRSILTLIFDVSFVLRIILQYIFSNHPFKILIIKTFTSIMIKEINSKILIREDPFKKTDSNVSKSSILYQELRYIMDIHELIFLLHQW